jgi:hypothetical protein
MEMKTLTLLSVALLAATASATEKPAELDFKLDPALRASNSTQGYTWEPGFGNTIWGTTGLIFIPSAYTVGHKDFSFGAAISEDFSSATVNYGFLKDIEVGVAYLDRSQEKNKAILNAKIHIVPANFDQFQLGIGVMDMADAVEQTFYVVGSAVLVVPDYVKDKGAIGLQVHAGVGTGYFSEKPFAGAELFFPKGWTLISEWDSKNLNASIRYEHNEEFFIQVGSFSSNAFFKMAYTMRF